MTTTKNIYNNNETPPIVNTKHIKCNPRCIRRVVLQVWSPAVVHCLQKSPS